MKCRPCGVTMTARFDVDSAITTHTCPDCGRPGGDTWDASVGRPRAGMVPSAVIESVHPVEPADASTDVTEAWLESSTTEYEPEPVAPGEKICRDTKKGRGCGKLFTPRHHLVAQCAECESRQAAFWAGVKGRRSA